MNDLRILLQDKIDNLNKPKGSLGRLESLALQIGMIQQTLSPVLRHPCHILFGGDHGIEREGVSFSPREVTWQQMINYGKGGGGVNMFCRQHGFSLRIVDVGVDYEFDKVEHAHIINRKIARGTADFLYESAMTETQWTEALSVGAEQVIACAEEGCNIISFGEMGIANTSPSSILMHLFLNIPLSECVGAGSGLSSDGIRHKYEVLRKAVDNSPYNSMMFVNGSVTSETNDESTRCLGYITDAVRYFVGFEMAAAIGGMLEAARRRMIILVDGFIMSACMLAASRISPQVLDYAVFGHCGDEGGHRRMLDAMGVEPLLSLGLRLGEGTGALCAFPIVQSAVNMINEMDNFSHAKITKYF